MRRGLLWLAINCAIKAAVSSGGDKSDKRRADVARVAAAGPTEPCWGSFTNGSRACASYDEALAADSAFPAEATGTATIVTAWCGDALEWAPKLISEPGPAAVWKRLVVYQKCAVYPRNATTSAVHFHHFMMAPGQFKEQVLPIRASGPDNTITAADVRALLAAHTPASASARTRAALAALEVRVVAMNEPGRGYPTRPGGRGGSSMYYSTDEVGAYLHYVSENYDDLLDGTFFCHGHMHGGLQVATRTMTAMARTGVAPQTYFGTTPHTADRPGAMPGNLGLANVQAKRSGNYRNAEFFASRLAIRRRSREFFQTALGFVEETARCADIYLGVPKPKLAPPFERYNDRSFACPARPRYHGSGRIEGYWDVLFCEPCVTPRREVDKRISRRRLQDALHIDASH